MRVRGHNLALVSLAPVDLLLCQSNAGNRLLGHFFCEKQLPYFTGRAGVLVGVQFAWVHVLAKLPTVKSDVPMPGFFCQPYHLLNDPLFVLFPSHELVLFVVGVPTGILTEPLEDTKRGNAAPDHTLGKC